MYCSIGKYREMCIEGQEVQGCAGEFEAQCREIKVYGAVKGSTGK